MSDIIKISETEAVARAHIVRAQWLPTEVDVLLLITTTGKCNVFGADARRVWREWVGERDVAKDALAYEEALCTIIHLCKKFSYGINPKLIRGIAEHALGLDLDRLSMSDAKFCGYYRHGDGTCAVAAGNTKCTYPNGCHNVGRQEDSQG